MASAWVEARDYMECNFSKSWRNSSLELKFGEHVIPQATQFKYLGSIVQNDREIKRDNSHQIQVGWLKWKRASGVLCDTKVPFKLKEFFYHTAVRSMVLYGMECRVVKNQHENKISAAEMKMLCWMYGKTRQDSGNSA